MTTETTQETRQAEFAAANAILRAVSESLPEEEVLRVALERTLPVLPAEAGEIFLMDGSGAGLRWALHAGEAPEAFAGRRSFATGEGIIGRAAEAREPQFFELAQAENLKRPAIRDAGFVRLAATPLIAKDRVWGVMNVATRHPDRLAPERRDFLEAVGRQIGLALAVSRALTAQEVMSQRLEAVNQAAASITTARTVDEALSEIAEQARALTHAGYAALGVHTSDGLLSKFIYSGVSEEHARLIGDPPHGRGLLGALREHPVIRVADLTEDARFRGFPPHHPLMRSFLGVSISSGDRVLGRLYLTEKEDGSEFSEEDEASVVALARHAAVAITNAGLYENLSRQTRYLAAVYEVGKRVTGSLDFDAVIDAVTEGAAATVGADASFVFVREEETPVLRCVATRGFKRSDIRGMLIGQHEGVIGRVTGTGLPLLVADVDQDPDVLRRITEPEGIRSLLLAPIRVGSRAYGVLGVAYTRLETLTVSAQEAIYALADLSAIAIENARLFDQARRLAVLEDRERIAMDLHDTTLQEIFAAGLRIEFAADRIDEAPAEARELLSGVVERLQKLNGSIRGYISTLSGSIQEERGKLDVLLETAVKQIDDALGSSTAVDVAPDPYPELPPPVVEQIILIVREAIANAHHHAGATTVRMSARLDQDRLHIAVLDDGRGFNPETAARAGHFGLRNMHERASRIGGTLGITSTNAGTTVELTLPLR